MKHLTFATLLSITVAITASSQTIDTAYASDSGDYNAVNYYKAAAKIQPLIVKFNDTDSVTHLVVRAVNDNLISGATLEWFLMDDKHIIHLSSLVQLSGTDYANWDHSAVQALVYAAGKIGGVVFK